MAIPKTSGGTGNVYLGNKIVAKSGCQNHYVYDFTQSDCGFTAGSFGQTVVSRASGTGRSIYGRGGYYGGNRNSPSGFYDGNKLLKIKMYYTRSSGNSQAVGFGYVNGGHGFRHIAEYNQPTKIGIDDARIEIGQKTGDCELNINFEDTYVYGDVNGSAFTSTKLSEDFNNEWINQSLNMHAISRASGTQQYIRKIEIWTE